MPDNGYISTTSESLVGSLCKEAFSIRIRSCDIIKSIRRSNNASLVKRLKGELSILQNRLLEIKKTADSLKSNESIDEFTTDFLIEITKRAVILPSILH